MNLKSKPKIIYAIPLLGQSTKPGLKFMQCINKGYILNKCLFLLNKL